MWRAIAPLMKPWCAEGIGADRREPEPLPGLCNRVWVGIATTNLSLESVCDAKLIVSVSLGSSVLFRWRRQSCPDDEGHFIPLGVVT